jgi:glycine/D-amino acid oxidase-like deaminating enzyme
VQPAAFVRGLADSLPEQVALFENTKVTALRRANGEWIATTAGGEVRAPTVVLAANTFVRDLGHLSPQLMAIYTYTGFTRPLTASELAGLGTREVWGVSPTFKYGTTMRRLANNRLMLGASIPTSGRTTPTASGAGSPRRSRHTSRISLTSTSTISGRGIIAITYGRAPYFGQLQDGLYATTGCSGSGIAKFTLLGKYLAEEIVGQKRLQTVLAVYGTPKWMPPDPVRKLGYLAASTWGKAMAGKDI